MAEIEEDPRDESSVEFEDTSFLSREEMCTISPQQSLLHAEKRRLSLQRHSETSWKGRVNYKNRTYCKLFEDLRLGPTVYSILTLYDNQVPLEQTHRFLNIFQTPGEGYGWISPDSWFSNTCARTSLDKCGEQSEPTELIRWPGLGPFQRLLVVALSVGAAAAAARRRNAQEVASLRQAIADRENALVLVKEELEMQRNCRTPNFRKHKTNGTQSTVAGWDGVEDLSSDCSSPITGGPGPELMEKMMTSKSWVEAFEVGLMSIDQSEELEKCEEASVNKDVVLEEKANTANTGALIPDSESCGVSENNGVQILSHSDPETDCIFEHDDEVPSYSNVSVSEDLNDDWISSNKISTENTVLVIRAQCAAVVLEIKRQVISLLEESVSNSIEALSSISKQVDELEASGNAIPIFQIQPDATELESIVPTLQKTVKMVADQISKLQRTMVECWDTLGPEAMSILEISPSEFDDFFASFQIAEILNYDALKLVGRNGSIQLWRKWFRGRCDTPEMFFLQKEVSKKTTAISFEVSSHNLNEEQVSNVPKVHSRRKKWDKDWKLPEADRSELGVLGIDVQAQEIMYAFEKAGEKVGGIQDQMNRLRSQIAASNIERENLERDLMRGLEQDRINKARHNLEVHELRRQVLAKESANQQLLQSSKAVSSYRSTEIAELLEECRRRDAALQDMAKAARVTQEVSDKRLAVLEEICRKKDATIVRLKEDIFSLESKVQELTATQAPSMIRPMNRTPDMDDQFLTPSSPRLFEQDEYQRRWSLNSFVGSERRTSCGSEISAQEFHIIDTPWSSDFCAAQEFHVIEEAAFQGRSLNIFDNVTSSQESVGKVEILSDASTNRRDRAENIPNHRKELSKSVSGGLPSRGRRKDDPLRASTGVLRAVGQNTPIKRVSMDAKDKSSQPQPMRPKENSGKSKRWL